MTPAPLLRVGLLGCGGIGRRHAESVRALPALMELVACCGHHAVETEKFARSFAAQAYTDFELMLATERLDLIIVALPPFAHTGQVERAARRGIHLLVEKPLGLEFEAARRMGDAVRESGVVAACGFIYRFGSAMVRWDDLVADGQVGWVGQFCGQYFCNDLHADWWRRSALSGGQIVEQLIHMIDLMRHVMGTPDRVVAMASNYFHRAVLDYEIEDQNAMLFGFDDGRIATISSSNGAIPGQWLGQWQVVAEEMTGLFKNLHAAEFVRTRPPVQNETINAEHDVFIAQLSDVANAIRHARLPRVSLTDGVKSMAIALASRQAATTGATVEIPRIRHET